MKFIHFKNFNAYKNMFLGVFLGAAFGVIMALPFFFTEIEKFLNTNFAVFLKVLLWINLPAWYMSEFFMKGDLEVVLSNLYKFIIVQHTVTGFFIGLILSKSPLDKSQAVVIK